MRHNYNKLRRKYIALKCVHRTLERLKINYQRINIKLEKEHNEKTIKGGENNKGTSLGKKHKRRKTPTITNPIHLRKWE